MHRRRFRYLVDPVDIWQLSEHLPYSISISWARHNEAGAFDALLRRRTSDLQIGEEQSDKGGILPIFPRRSHQPLRQNRASEPLQQSRHRKLGAELRRYTKERLPDGLHPSAFMFVDELT